MRLRRVHSLRGVRRRLDVVDARSRLIDAEEHNRQPVAGSLRRNVQRLHRVRPAGPERAVRGREIHRAAEQFRHLDGIGPVVQHRDDEGELLGRAVGRILIQIAHQRHLVGVEGPRGNGCCRLDSQPRGSGGAVIDAILHAAQRHAGQPVVAGVIGPAADLRFGRAAADEVFRVDGRGVVGEAEDAGDIQRLGVGVEVPVLGGRHEVDGDARSEHRRAGQSGVVDGTFLVQRDLARLIHRDHEGQKIAGCRAAFDRPAGGFGQDDGLVRQHVCQAAGGAGQIEAVDQRSAACRAVIAVIDAEAAGVGLVIRAQRRVAGLDAGQRARVDRHGRLVVTEREDARDVQRVAVGVAVAVGDGADKLHDGVARQPDGVVVRGLRMEHGQVLRQRHAGPVVRDGEDHDITGRARVVALDHRLAADRSFAQQDVFARRRLQARGRVRPCEVQFEGQAVRVRRAVLAIIRRGGEGRRIVFGVGARKRVVIRGDGRQTGAVGRDAGFVVVDLEGPGDVHGFRVLVAVVVGQRGDGVDADFACVKADHVVGCAGAVFDRAQQLEFDRARRGVDRDGQDRVRTRRPGDDRARRVDRQKHVQPGRDIVQTGIGARRSRCQVGQRQLVAKRCLPVVARIPGQEQRRECAVGHVHVVAFQTGVIGGQRGHRGAAGIDVRHIIGEGEDARDVELVAGGVRARGGIVAVGDGQLQADLARRHADRGIRAAARRAVLDRAALVQRDHAGRADRDAEDLGIARRVGVADDLAFLADGRVEFQKDRLSRLGIEEPAVRVVDLQLVFPGRLAVRAGGNGEGRAQAGRAGGAVQKRVRGRDAFARGAFRDDGQVVLDLCDRVAGAEVDRVVVGVLGVEQPCQVQRQEFAVVAIVQLVIDGLKQSDLEPPVHVTIGIRVIHKLGLQDRRVVGFTGIENAAFDRVLKLHAVLGQRLTDFQRIQRVQVGRKGECHGLVDARAQAVHQVDGVHRPRAALCVVAARQRVFADKRRCARAGLGRRVVPDLDELSDVQRHGLGIQDAEIRDRELQVVVQRLAVLDQHPVVVDIGLVGDGVVLLQAIDDPDGVEAAAARVLDGIGRDGKAVSGVGVVPGQGPDQAAVHLHFDDVHVVEVVVQPVVEGRPVACAVRFRTRRAIGILNREPGRECLGRAGRDLDELDRHLVGIEGRAAILDVLGVAGLFAGQIGHGVGVGHARDEGEIKPVARRDVLAVGAQRGLAAALAAVNGKVQRLAGDDDRFIPAYAVPILEGHEGVAARRSAGKRKFEIFGHADGQVVVQVEDEAFVVRRPEIVDMLHRLELRDVEVDAVGRVVGVVVDLLHDDDEDRLGPCHLVGGVQRVAGHPEHHLWVVRVGIEINLLVSDGEQPGGIAVQGAAGRVEEFEGVQLGRGVGIHVHLERARIAGKLDRVRQRNKRNVQQRGVEDRVHGCRKGVHVVLEVGCALVDRRSCVCGKKCHL